MNISALPARNARYRPSHLAVVVGEQALTWAEFNGRINRCANMLGALGVGKGDKVATILGNCLELLEVYWAVAKIGAVAVPLSALLRPAGIATLLRDSDTVVAIATERFAEPLAAVKSDIPNIADDRYLLVDSDDRPGYRSYHALCQEASEDEPPTVPSAATIPTTSSTAAAPPDCPRASCSAIRCGPITARSFRRPIA